MDDDGRSPLIANLKETARVHNPRARAVAHDGTRAEWAENGAGWRNGGLRHHDWAGGLWVSSGLR